jgi:hypothetical protein
VRRVAAVDLLEPGPAGPRGVALATWDRKRDTHVYAGEAHAESVARRLGTSPVVLRAAVRARAVWLDDLLARGESGPTGLRAALAAYRASGAP